MNLSASDLAFVVDRLDRRGKIYTAKDRVGRRVIVEATLGYHDAVRLGALIGAHEPRPNGDKWRVRVRGNYAKELVTYLLPHLSEKDRHYALAALAQAADGATRRAETPLCRTDSEASNLDASKAVPPAA